MRSLQQIFTRNHSNLINPYPILVLNAGSSSLKYKLFKVENQSLLAECHGKFEQIANGINQEFEYQYTHYDASNIKSAQYVGSTKDRMDYIKSMNILFDDLLTLNTSTSSLIIGHRIVHGGNTYSDPQLIDNNVIKTINKYSRIAPLHNPYQLQCIQAANAHSIGTQFAIFDTAFHSRMPEYVSKYAINKETALKYENNHNIEIRKYGFHGISYQYILDKTCRYLNVNKQDLNLIVIHLGSGCSACCIENGISIDTSMGFTPNEGLIMGTRCGDIDCGLVLELMEDENIEYIKNVLNKQSGLKGICGINDMRHILYSQNIENNEYELALNMFAYRIKKYIGSYYALLNGNVNALVFTGGIGENIPHKLLIKIVGDLHNLGFNLNDIPNNDNDDQQEIISWNNHKSNSHCIPILSIKTDEELAIAQQIQHKLLFMHKS